MGTRHLLGPCGYCHVAVQGAASDDAAATLSDVVIWTTIVSETFILSIGGNIRTFMHMAEASLAARPHWLGLSAQQLSASILGLLCLATAFPAGVPSESARIPADVRLGWQNPAHATPLLSGSLSKAPTSDKLQREKFCNR